MTLERPHSPGVVQRVIHRGEDFGEVEWLAFEDGAASDWTRDPLRAAVFFDDDQPDGKTGFERATECADRLKAATPELSIFITPARREVKRAATAPAMPARFFSRGRVERAKERAEHDWRDGKPNCGLD